MPKDSASFLSPTQTDWSVCRSADSRKRLAIVGGGLAGGLLAWRLNQLPKAPQVLLLEKQGPRPRSHTWCFHQHDLSPAAFGWLHPLIAASWNHYQVVFPQRRRRMASGYFALRSDEFRSRLQQALGERLLMDCEVARLSPRQLELTNGQRLNVDAVIDARGLQPAYRPGAVGYQVFLGLELHLEAPHRLRGPVLMDATVAQQGAFRFMYVLPWDARHVLIEDTRYTLTPDFDRARSRADILAYARQQGWRPAAVLGEERGCLPLPLQPDYALAAGDAQVPGLGMRTGLFHYVTGYSLPETIRLIEQLVATAEQHRWEAEGLSAAIAAWREGWLSRQRYFLLLNRLLFEAAEPEQRYRVLERFYGLPESLIQAFYAGRLSPWDQARLLLGKPPVSPWRALKCLPQRRTA